MAYELNELGYMYRPDFHDGALSGIIIAGSTVKLMLRTVSNEAFHVTLWEVEALQVDDFNLGNIVMNVRLITGHTPSPDDLATLYPGPHPSVPRGVHEEHAQFIARQIGRIDSGEAILFQITSSYGCDLSAICARVEILADRHRHMSE